MLLLKFETSRNFMLIECKPFLSKYVAADQSCWRVNAEINWMPSTLMLLLYGRKLNSHGFPINSKPNKVLELHMKWLQLFKAWCFIAYLRNYKYAKEWREGVL